MKRDDAEKLIDSLTDAAQECECAEFLNDLKLSESASKKIDKLRAKLLAALTPPDQPNQPDGPGRYQLTVAAEVKYGDMFSLNGRDWFGIDSITGTWRKGG